MGILSHLEDDIDIFSDAPLEPSGALSHLKDDIDLTTSEGTLFQEAESEGVPFTAGAGPAKYTRTVDPKKMAPKESHFWGAFKEAVRGLGDTLYRSVDTIGRKLAEEPEWSPEDEARSIFDPTFGRTMAPDLITGEMREVTPR